MKISEAVIREFEPKRSWLRHDSHYHGIGHLTRVLILQELICENVSAQGEEVNRQALRFAAMTHDVGRVDDGLDIRHGTRSAEWIEQNLSHKMTPEMLDTVTYIVHWHVPSDDKAPVMTNELKILKDADALDRVRLGDLNPHYLRTSIAKDLIDIAQALYDESIKDSDDDFEAVIGSAKRIGLITSGSGPKFSSMQ